MDRRGPPSMPGAEPVTSLPTRQGSTCYAKLLFGLQSIPGWLFVRSPDPAVRLTTCLHVTRRRSGTGTPAVAEDWGQETTARTSLHKTNFSSVLDRRVVEKREKTGVQGAINARERKGPPTFWHKGNLVGPFRLRHASRSTPHAHSSLS